MICCQECFKDEQLRSIIYTMDKKGDCEVCGSKDTYIYDTDKNNELEECIDALLDIYYCQDGLPEDYPKRFLNYIYDELYSRWGLFNIKPEKIKEVIINICKDRYKSEPNFFSGMVGIKELNEKDSLEKNCILKNYQWNDFVYSIKNVNRFHSDHLNKEVFKRVCFDISKDLIKNTVLYRGRISDKDGFTAKNMGAPPPNLISAGRANSSGISCLYLSDDINTTIHEIRARDLDYVSIGYFYLKRDIRVVDISYMDNLSPFATNEFEWFAINIGHLREIANQIAKPLRRQDSVLDYLPAQYISDFVKHIGYDGIKYKSTLTEGNNYAIFNEKLFKCSNVEVYNINTLEYKVNLLGKSL